MKKIMMVALCLMFVLLLVGCSNTQKSDIKPVSEEIIVGTVLAIEDGAMTIEVKEKPIEEMKSTSLNVPITNMPSSPEPVVGDTVDITYNGKITTTTPEGGIDVYSISSADIKHIEVKR